jgi:hypothetical protein
MQSMPTPIEGTTKLILDRFENLAASNLTEFRQFFRRLRKLFPDQAAEASLLYVAKHGIDEAANSMAFWFGADETYISVLLDLKRLPAETAFRAVSVVRGMDPQFLFKFAKATGELQSPAAIQRALGLLPATGDYSVLFPWLHRLSKNADSRVRSYAAKLVCELNPNTSLVEHQMHSADARVRANAVETLAHTTDIEAARTLFRAALSDSNHRVVGNAMVGLYQLGETGMLNEMIELCDHEDYRFRSAMAWAMGSVKDVRAIPTLQELTEDVSLVVRKRALHSLLLLEALPGQAKATTQAGDLPSQEPEQSGPGEGSALKLSQA